MKKYKICPMCQTKNAPSVLECIECGTDLMGIRIVDDSFLENKQSENPPIAKQVQQEELVRKCECGQENELSARKCIACGEDISDIIPSPKSAPVAQPTYFVKTIDGVATIRLDFPSEHIIGREHELAEYLKNKLFVSRKHALITVTSEGVFIQNLSNANGTYVNNERIDNNSAIKLCKNDEIGLGGLVNQNGRQDMAAYLVVGID